MLTEDNIIFKKYIYMVGVRLSLFLPYLQFKTGGVEIPFVTPVYGMTKKSKGKKNKG